MKIGCRKGPSKHGRQMVLLSETSLPGQVAFDSQPINANDVKIDANDLCHELCHGHNIVGWKRQIHTFRRKRLSFA